MTSCQDVLFNEAAVFGTTVDACGRAALFSDSFGGVGLDQVQFLQKQIARVGGRPHCLIAFRGKLIL